MVLVEPNLAEKVEVLAKEIAELKVQVSARQTVDIDKVADELAARLQKVSSKIIFDSRSLD